MAGAEYINSVKRVEGVNNQDRSGDIILLFKDYTDDVPSNRFTSGVACKSWHGGLNPSDSYVPLIVAYPGGDKTEIVNIVNTVCANNSCDGNWRLTDLIKQFIKTQY